VIKKGETPESGSDEATPEDLTQPKLTDPEKPKKKQQYIPLIHGFLKR